MAKGQELAGRGDQAELLGSGRLDGSQEEGVQSPEAAGEQAVGQGGQQ